MSQESRDWLELTPEEREGWLTETFGVSGAQTDLNACHEIEGQLRVRAEEVVEFHDGGTSTVMNEYIEELADLVLDRARPGHFGDAHFEYAHATAAERCCAFWRIWN